jgi:chromosomal replication initiator protein
VDERVRETVEEPVDETSELWTRCTASLREQVSDPTWQVWFSGIEPLGFSDGVLVLGVGNPVVRERLRSRFLGLIQDTLVAEAKQPVQVRLQVLDAVDAPGAGAADPGVPPLDRPGPGGQVHRLDPAPGNGRAAGRRGADDAGPGQAGRGRGDPSVSLDPRYRFESFVAASSNRLAKAAAEAAAENPGRSYNPLFIYGESGLGKTHLLHAIGNYVNENFPMRRVLYVTTETFMNDFVDALRMGATIAFKRRYRECDVLLIDDVQFMENKEGLQEEFFHTYNDLHGASKQIVLTSDRPPKSIETLEHRLRSRFLSGLLTEINPPDLETRLAILGAMVERAHGGTGPVPADVLEFIATHVTNNIRELEGALIRVTAFARLNDEDISLALAERVLSDLVSAGEPRRISPQTIIEATADAYGFTVEQVCGPSRTRPLVTARQVAMYLVRDMTEFSYPAIARVFGGRDHTTVIHAVDKISKQMGERRQIYEQVTALLLQIKQSS